MKRIIRKKLCLALTAAWLFGIFATGCAPEEHTLQTQQTTQPTPQEYTLEKQAGCRQLTLYWNHNDSYENCDVWIWWGDVAGKGYEFHPCDYGAKMVVNVPQEIEEVGFIVRKNCSDPGGSAWGSATKDYEQDRFAVLEGEDTVIYLKSGDPAQYTSNDGGKTLQMIKKFSLAEMVDQYTIRYRITPASTLSDIGQIRVYEGDTPVAVAEASSLGKSAVSGTLTLEKPLDLSKGYRMEIEGYGESPVVPIGIFDSEYFAENYHYDGDDLGAVIRGDSTTFKVWAPTAQKVVLNLFASGHQGDAYRTVEMVRQEKGVWCHTEPCGHGTYYTYTVTTSAGTQEAMDPYAKTAGANGNRGMVVALAQTDPEGWAADSFKTGMDSYSDAVIWEVHVRDFSNRITGTAYPGKYLAFTETGLVNEHGQAVGVDYLKELGITHVHLLPVYDYATVDETDPESGFNWGYDPKNYNVPEGSYSTDPYNGQVRIREFKQMVQALHNAGIGVIMDMVYNHTYDANSCFNRIVPYYYYRYTASGANSSASGCGNDTASERYMFRKFMVESTAYWVEQYHLDGLRFDLMGLHDLQTMQQVEQAVHAVNPQAILYGEGWTMGATVDGSPQANQSNISQIRPTGDAIGAVAVFNDAIRDGLKGSVFDKTSKGYISGEAKLNQSKVLFGIRGGTGSGQVWRVENSMVINYMSAHDNHTLWDKLALSNPDDDTQTRAKMNRLGAAILMISKGTPFWQAGEEMLRTKGGDENSYKSSDGVNNIDWSALEPGTLQHSTMLYYKGLITMRKTFDIFTDPGSAVTHQEYGSGILTVSFQNEAGQKALVVINPHKTALPCTLEGQWQLVADGTQAGDQILCVDSGEVTVDALSVRIYVAG